VPYEHLFALAALLAAPLGAGAAVLSITAQAFEAGGSIPTDLTCQGRNRAPALHFAGVPTGTRSLALVLLDPDAHQPESPPVSYVHWVLYDLPADCAGLVAGAKGADFPAGTQEGRNDRGDQGYFGPCPEHGRHSYHFTLYALDVAFGPGSPLTAAELAGAMKGHVLAQAELVASYSHQNRFMARLRRLFGL
jgi:Raf kinase inhibitor-like YbhB/YbcL family protein